MDDIDKFFIEVKQKRREDKEKLESDRKSREETIRNSLNTTLEQRSQRMTINHEINNKKGTAQFKAVTREQRERILSNTIGSNENMPEVGKYTPKYGVIRS